MHVSGLEDYLVLLSIWQTCVYRGVSFFDFLLSGERTSTGIVRRCDSVGRQELNLPNTRSEATVRIYFEVAVGTLLVFSPLIDGNNLARTARSSSPCTLRPV